MPRAEMLSQPLRSLCDCNKFIVWIAAVSKLLSLRGSKPSHSGASPSRVYRRRPDRKTSFFAENRCVIAKYYI